MDPTHWGDPENFRPERFISPEGKFQKDDHLMLFGTGEAKIILIEGVDHFKSNNKNCYRGKSVPWRAFCEKLIVHFLHFLGAKIRHANTITWA